MKVVVVIMLCLFAINQAKGQEEVTIKDLALPSSPAFILTDVTPTLVQSPNTPKKFVLGLAQSYSESPSGFPENYSAEFTPYWFINPAGQNVYAAVGLKTKLDSNGQIVPVEEVNIFSGLKFTNLSIAFINKDLIPDDIDASHKTFAIGFKTTLIKAQQTGYAKKMYTLITDWHTAAQQDLKAFEIRLEALTTQATQPTQAELDKVRTEFDNQNEIKSLKLGEDIGELIQQKPKFSWELAGAYATYGIGDEAWQTGRTGVWSTVSTYLPFSSPNREVSRDYLNLNVVARSLWDNFTLNEQGQIVKNNSIDVGGKVAFEFNEFSIGAESLYRKIDGEDDLERRTIGLINYRISENVFLIGAFGKNFESQSRSVAMFGINWGFGPEKIAF